MGKDSKDQGASYGVWYKEANINVSVSANLGGEKLIKLLTENRKILEDLKKEYCQIMKKSGGGARFLKEREKEIARVEEAINVIKNQIAAAAKKVPFSEYDEEHPESACKRFSAGGRSARSDGCFPEGTMITTMKGDVDIKNIKMGDLVQTLDKNIKRYSYQKVVEIKKHTSNRLWVITYSNGKKLKTTAAHSFFGRGKWIRASGIRKGDEIFCLGDGGKLISEKVISSCISEETADVYNLVVEKNFNFIANGSIAHCFSYFRVFRVLFWQFYLFYIDFFDERRRIPVNVKSNDNMSKDIYTG